MKLLTVLLSLAAISGCRSFGGFPKEPDTYYCKLRWKTDAKDSYWYCVNRANPELKGRVPFEEYIKKNPVAVSLDEFTLWLNFEQEAYVWIKKKVGAK